MHETRAQFEAARNAETVRRQALSKSPPPKKTRTLSVFRLGGAGDSRLGSWFFVKCKTRDQLRDSDGSGRD